MAAKGCPGQVGRNRRWYFPLRGPGGHLWISASGVRSTFFRTENEAEQQWPILRGQNPELKADRSLGLKTGIFSSQKPGHHLCFLPSYPCSTQLITKSLCFCLTLLSCPRSPHSTCSGSVSGPLTWAVAEGFWKSLLLPSLTFIQPISHRSEHALALFDHIWGS